MSKTTTAKIDRAYKLLSKYGTTKLEKYIKRSKIDVNEFSSDNKTLGYYIAYDHFSDRGENGIRMLRRYGLDLSKPAQKNFYGGARNDFTMRGLLIERGHTRNLIEDGLEKVDPNQVHESYGSKHNLFTLTLDNWRKAYPLEHLERLASDLETVNSDDLSGGASEFLWACGRSPSLAVIKTLVDKGADINFKDSSGNNAIHWAFKNNRLSESELKGLVEYLVSEGCDVQHRNNDGENVWFTAAYTDVRAEVAMHAGVSLNSPNDSGYSIIEDVIRKGKGDAFDRLMAFLPDGDTPPIPFSDDGGGPFHLLKNRGTLTGERIKTLVRKGYDINQQDKDGNTILHRIHSNSDMLKAALEVGADPLIPNNSEITPLYDRYTDNRSRITDSFQLMVKHLSDDYDPTHIRKIIRHVKDNSYSSDEYLEALEPYSERLGWTVSDKEPEAVFVQQQLALGQRVTDHFNFKTRERYTKIEILKHKDDPDINIMREQLNGNANVHLWRQAAIEVCRAHGESSAAAKYARAAIASVGQKASQNDDVEAEKPKLKSVHPIKSLKKTP